MVRPRDCVRVSDKLSLEAREKGNDAFKKKNVKEALRCYDVAQERAESSEHLVKALTNRSLCYIKLGEFEDAQFDCQEALRLDPKSVKAHYRLGVCYKANSDIESARKCFEQSLKIQPDHKASLKHLELLKKQQENPDTAATTTNMSLNEYRELAMMVFPERSMREQIGGVLNIEDNGETFNSMLRELVEMGQGEIRVEDAKGVLNYLKNTNKKSSRELRNQMLHFKNEKRSAATPPPHPRLDDTTNCSKTKKKRRPLKLSPLHLAARSGNTKALKQAIESDKSQIDTPGFGNTPLAWAAKSGSLECVRILLDSGAKLQQDEDSKNDDEDFDASAPLHYAASRGFKEIVDLFLKRGANMKSRDSVLGGTLLHCVVTSKCSETMVPYILDLDSTLLDCTDSRNITALGAACKSGRLSVVSTLLDRGAKPVLGNPSPLCLALRHDHEDVVKTLLNIEVVQKSISTDPFAVYEALCSSRTSPIDLNAISSSNVTILHLLATQKRVDVLKKLNPFPSSLLNTPRDEDGRTALMLSLIPKDNKEPTSTETLKFILSKRPSLDIKDKTDGNTALHIAGKLGFEEAFEILKRVGASQTVTNNKDKVAKLMDPSKCCIM